MKRPLRSACLVLALLALARSADAQAGFNVDFGTTHGTPAASYGAASGQAGSWNQAGLGVTALNYLSGSPSGASVSVSTFTAGGFVPGPTNDDELLLYDNFFSSGGGAWSVTLSGLASGAYRVFLYAPANTLVSSGSMTVAGIPVASITGDAGGDLVEGVSWVSIVVTVSGTTLAISGTATSASGLAGLQLVPLAAPAVNVDFGTVFGTPPSGYGAAAGQPGSWNQVALGVTQLVGTGGGASGVRISLSAETAAGNGNTPITDDQLLLNDNFYSSGGATWTLTLSGLGGGTYRVFLYAPQNVAVPTGTMNVGGTVVASIPGSLDGVLIEGVSWTSVLVPAAGGSLTISGAGSLYSGLAGLQLVPIRLTPPFNVDFGTAFGTPAATYGAASGRAGSWNQAGLGTTSLVDLAGKLSGLTVTVSASSPTGAATAPTNDDQLLLNDNFFASFGGSWSVTLSNLGNGNYGVFLYAPTNSAVSSGNMQVGGVPVASIPGDMAGTLIEGTTWVRVEVTVSTGALVITGSGPGFSGLAGLQLVPIPRAALNLDFGTAFGTPASGYGAAAGQVGFWNPLALGSASLLDLGGLPSHVSVNVAATTATGSYLPPTNDDQQLLNDNFFRSGPGSWSVSLTNLALGEYAVFLYAPSNPVITTGNMNVGGVPVPDIPGNLGGTLVEGTSWARTVAPVTDGTLAISGGESATGLAGLQIRYVPEPGPIALLASGAALLAVLARRRMA